MRCRGLLPLGPRYSALGTWLLLLSALPLFPLSAQVITGDSLWAAGNYPAARAAYERGLKEEPGSVRALFRLGILVSWDGKLDSALALYHYARTLEPNDPDVRFQEATVLSWKGSFTASLARWDSLQADYPARHDIALARARTLSWAGRMRQADSAYAALAGGDPPDLDALAGRGQVAAWQGDYASAIRYYRQALALDPDHVPSLVGLGQVRQWQGRPGEAELAINHALALAPNDRSAREAQLAIRALRRPQATVTLGWSHDSDRNTLWWQEVGTSLLLGPGVRGFARAGVAEASDPVRSGSRLSGEVGASRDAGQLSLSAALGARQLASDAAADHTVGTWRAGASYRFGPGAGAGLSYAHYAFDETALLLGRGLRIDELSLDGNLELRPTLSLGVGAGLGWISDDNRRRSAVVNLTQRVAQRFTLGVFGRALGYHQPGTGYFAPNRFLVGELRGGYTYGVRHWEGRLSGGFGAQQIGQGSRAQSEWHGEVRLAHRWATINEIALSGGISNSAESSTTGAFRYYTAGLSVRVGL